MKLNGKIMDFFLLYLIYNFASSFGELSCISMNTDSFCEGELLDILLVVNAVKEKVYSRMRRKD